MKNNYWLKDTVTGNTADFNTMSEVLEAARNWSRIFEHEIKVYVGENDVGVYYMGDFTSLV